MADSREIVEKAYADSAKGDVPAVLAVLADDIAWSEAEGDPLWTGSPAVGPQGVLEQVFLRLARTTTASPSLSSGSSGTATRG